MKEDRGPSEASTIDSADPARPAPGKRTRTGALPAVQQRAVEARPPDIAPSVEPMAGASEDPFSVHLLGGNVQRDGGGGGGGAEVHAAAARGLEQPAQSLPFLDQIQKSFGADHDLGGVQAHVGGAAAEASAAMGASAYATGGHVAFGQSPDLHTAAHEAAHVVQQAQGVNLYGGVGQVGDSYERNADAVADRVVAGQSAADLLGDSGTTSAGGTVQRKAASESSWVVSARAYHQRHPEYAEQFKSATGGACVGEDGELDPAAIARWQQANGVKPDGKCGPLTVAAAMGEKTTHPAGDAPAPEPKTAPAPGHVDGPGGTEPTQAPATVAPAIKPPAVEPHVDQEPKEKEPHQPVVKGEPMRFVLDGGAEKIGFQKCLVFVSPGGLSSATPDVFLFFHGYQADYGIDNKQKKPKGMSLSASGSDVAAEAMQRATGKNLVAILPQGNIGRGDEAGGRMKGLKAGLPTFLSSVLGGLAGQLGAESLSPGRISIAGHSAGGYEGVHSAMKGAGDLADKITDLTLMDSSYSTSHFHDARDWIFSGSPGKTLTIVGQKVQLRDHSKFHGPYFNPGPLASYAKAHDMEVKHLPDGDKRDHGTVLQHSQLFKDGVFHADILIYESKRNHGQIRDDAMDDAMLNVGAGAAHADTFDRTPSEADQDPNAPDQPATGKAAAKLEEQANQPPGQSPDEHGETPDLPVAEHADDMKSPEKVKTPPSPSTPVRPAGKEIYKKGGRLHHDKLSKGALSDAEYDFKKRVYDACTARLGDKIFGGVAKDDLEPISDGGGKIRKDVKGPLESMLAAMKSAIAAGTPAKGKEVGTATGIQVGNGYRSPEVDFGLWDHHFAKYMRLTAEAREATGNPVGSESVKLMVKFIAPRKAPPGGSNHSNGTAVDLKMEHKGKAVGNDYDNQKLWRKSWHLAWLQENAASFGFKEYSKEAWHWTYQG